MNELIANIGLGVGLVLEELQVQFQKLSICIISIVLFMNEALRTVVRACSASQHVCI